MTRKKPIEAMHEVQQRRKRALELRLSGLNQSQIADEMGLHKSTISDYIHHALADITREDAEVYLQIELDRIEAMLSTIWPDIMAKKKGSEWKIDRAIALIDQRARLTGTYKSAELKAIAAAKGGISSGAASMLDKLFDAMELAVDAADAVEEAEPDE